MRFSWTLALIGISFLVFLLQLTIPLGQFAFRPANILTEPWTLVTSVFMHGSFTHILFNMFALFMFGIFLESKISEKFFLANYFLAGIFGNLMYFMTDPTSPIPAVGASGAIYGVMGALTVLYPRMIVYVGLGLPMPMIVAAIFWVVINFIGLFNPSGIAYQAHLGGIFIGVLFGIYLRMKNRKKTEYRYFFE